MALDGKAIGLVGALEEQARANSAQSVAMMAALDTNMSATLVGDPRAGEKQIPPEDAHHHILELLRLEIALNLHKILSEEAKGISATDYKDVLDVIEKLKEAAEGGASFMADAKARIKKSRGQLADVIATNAVHMDSGNRVDILTANEFRILRTAMWRAGTALRWEAPLIVDNAHTRIMLAHSLLQEADLLTQRAVNMVASIKEVYGVTAEHAEILAKQKLHLAGHETTLVGRQKVRVDSGAGTDIASDGPIVIKGSRVEINPTARPTKPPYVQPAGQPIYRSKEKKHLELPQYEGMSPLPAYVTPEDEVKLQKGGE